MYTKQPKKMIIINILDILKRYTDENHRLSQREIMDILEREYDMKVDRKAVKRNLMNLIDFGYQVEYSESIRQGKNGEEEIIFTDWYLEKDFTDSELRLLIDSLLFSKHIPYPFFVPCCELEYKYGPGKPRKKKRIRGGSENERFKNIRFTVCSDG